MKREVVSAAPTTTATAAAKPTPVAVVEDNSDTDSEPAVTAKPVAGAVATTVAVSTGGSGGGGGDGDDDEDDNSNVDLVFDKCVFAFLGTKDLVSFRERVEAHGGLVSLKINSRVRVCARIVVWFCCSVLSVCALTQRTVFFAAKVTHVVVLNGVASDYAELKTIDRSKCAVVNTAFVVDSIDATVLKDCAAEAYCLLPKTAKSAKPAAKPTSTASTTTTTSTKRKEEERATPHSPGKTTKLVVKGRAAVDPASGMASDCRVLDEGGTHGVWDAMLNQVARCL